MSKEELEQIRSLKRKLKDAQEVGQEWRDFAIEMENQRDRSFERLRWISEGLCEGGIPEEWTYPEKLRATASRFFKSEAIRGNNKNRPWRAP
jgi:hypothetical protein